MDKVKVGDLMRVVPADDVFDGLLVKVTKINYTLSADVNGDVVVLNGKHEGLIGKGWALDEGNLTPMSPLEQLAAMADLETTDE